MASKRIWKDGFPTRVTPEFEQDRGSATDTPSPPSSDDVEPDTEHGMSSEELAGRFGAHFKPAAPEAGVEAASPLHKESCVSQALDNGRFPVRDVAEAGVEVEREEAVEYLKWAEDWTPDTVARWREARKRKKGE